MAEQFTGTVEVLNSSSGMPTILLDGGDHERGGNLVLGGNGQDGDLVIRDRSGRQRIYMNGDTVEVFLESKNGVRVVTLDGERGLLRITEALDVRRGTVEILNSDSGKPTIVLEGGDDERGGNLTVGGNGQDGDLTIRDTSGRQRIYMNGDTAEARFERTDGTISLALDGERGEIRIHDWTISAPDHVFADDYELPSLDELQRYVSTHRHLPEIPAADEFAREGINVGRLSMLLLQKIEELLLHGIRQQHAIDRLNERLAALEQGR